VTERVFERLCEIVDSSPTADAAMQHQKLQLISQQVIADGQLLFLLYSLQRL